MNSWHKNLLFSLLFCSYLFTTYRSFAQEYVINYTHLTSKNGLANDFVNCALQDSQGFMWFGTNDGLCRYDGNQFKVFRANEEEGIFLNSNAIQIIIQKNNHQLYVGTSAGLSELDIYTQKIKNIPFFDKKNITFVFIDNKGNTWVIANYALYVLENKTKNWKEYASDYPDLKNRQIKGIYQRKWNSKEYLVIAEEFVKNATHFHNLMYLDTQKNDWKKLLTTSFYLNYFEENGTIWLSHSPKHTTNALLEIQDSSIFKVHVIPILYNFFRKSGLPFSSSIQKNQEIDSYYSYYPEQIVLFDTKNKQVSRYLDFTKTIVQSSNYSIVFIYRDNTDNLWICTQGGGIAVVPFYTLFSWREYKYDKDNPQKSISQKSIRAIYQDEKTQNTWIAPLQTEGEIDVFLADSIKKNVNVISSAYMIKESPFEDSILWIASDKKLLKLDKNKKVIIKKYGFDRLVGAFLCLNDSSIWVADDEILKKLNPQTRETIIYSDIKDVSFLYQTKDKTNWIGSKLNGIAILNTTSPTEKLIYYNPEKNKKITTFHVKCIYEDSKGILWIGSTNGLYYFNRNTKIFKKYTQKEGLSNNMVYGILEDENYNLWLSTNYGISKFNIKKQTFQNYDESDGLQNNEFNTQAFFKSKKGELFFGGIDGVNAFYPKNIKRNTCVPKMYLTQVKKGDSTMVFDKPLHQIKEISLPVEDAKLLTFEFVALNYYQPQKNQYAYKIEELHEDWISLENTGKLTLTGLAHGNYTLHIKGSNNHGIWNEEGIKLKILVIPPFWLQGWFIATTVFFFLLGTYLIYRWQIYRSYLREIALQQVVEERTKEISEKNIFVEEQNKELEEANHTKDQLFGIIAHDLRSPITAFEDISKQIDYFLRKDDPQELRKLGGYIDNSVQNLNFLLNNLLHWALTQQKHQIRYFPQSISLSKNIKEVITTYEMLAQSNKIEFEISISDSIFIWVDIDSFQTILRNLISNALKYTPQNGKVIVTATTENEKVILKIRDTGIGMSKEFQKNLFKLNIATNKQGLRGEKSTGLGLIVTHEFCQMNKIDIQIESSENEGTTFILFIPES